MSSQCPLPVEWLSFVEGQPDAPSGSHLDECLACREFVELLKEEADSPKTTESRWLEALDLSQSRPWVESHPGHWSFGDVWLSASSYESKGYQYRDLDRLPMLILGEAPSTDGFKWLEVAPMWVDSEHAGQTDLVLESGHTTLGSPFRVMFSLQTVVAWDQLDSLVGKLTSSGATLMTAAIAGALDESHFGIPLSEPDEWRLAADRSIREITSVLAGFYAMRSEANVDAVNDLAADVAPRTHRTVEMEIQQVVSGRSLALAASMGGGDVEYRVVLKTGRQVLEAQLKQEFTQDTLFIIIESLRQIDAPVRFITNAERLQHPVITPWHSVRVGDSVTLGTGLGVLPAEVHLHVELQ